MRKILSIAILISVFQISKSQDSTRHLEFGSTLLTINSFRTNYYYAPDRPSFEILNGLFFRYTKNRAGFRLHTSYTENKHSYSSPMNWSDRESGTVTNKDFRLGLGGQYSLLKKREWLYAFVDLSYRYLKASGQRYGGLWGINETFFNRSHGFDSFLGFGFKIKTLKNVYLSPEFGYYLSTNFVKQLRVPVSGPNSTEFRYVQTNLNPAIKLHLTVKF